MSVFSFRLLRHPGLSARWSALRRMVLQHKRLGITAACVGMVLVAAAVGYRMHVAHQNEQASDAYVEAMALCHHDNPHAACGPLHAQAMHAISERYPRTTYAVFAAWWEARHAVHAEDWERATQRLIWAEQHARHPYLRVQTRIRLARVAMAQGQPDVAWTWVGTLRDPAYQALIDAVQGDVLREQGRFQEALERGRTAWAAMPEGAARYGLKRKWNSLPRPDTASDHGSA